MALVRITQGTSSDSNTRRGYLYDVFLSFRGEDTRKKFTDHLYTALINAGYRTFRDDDELQTGEDIKSGLKQAIQMSQTSIIVFSKDYASSRWCLNELVEIVDHKRTSSDHVVIPVFYDVDPSHVRKQTGSFAKAFARHRKTEPSDRMKRWSEALAEVADLAGKVLQNQANGYESRFIKDIVKVIRDKLSRTHLSVESKLVGIHYQVEHINLWLQDPSHDVGIFVVYGLPGIGKTTIAKCVYNSNFKSFEGSSYVESIRETASHPDGLVQIQKQILYDILNGEKEKIHNVSEGIIKIERAISTRRVLLVLDDVDHMDQLDAVLRMKDQFYPGSKIIITTRRTRLLRAREGVTVHEVGPLGFDASLELLSWHAFGQDHPREGYEKYSKEVVQHSGRLPLALKVLGSSLFEEPERVWKSTLEKLEVIPNGEIMNKLRISYDSLQDDHDRKLFLHIFGSMAKVAAGNDHPVGQTAVRIVVAGDRGTGKSSLIVTAATENFPANVPPVLPPTRLPEDFYPERVPITLIDTSSRAEDTNKVAEELKRADAVVLTYACNQPQTLDRLSTFWLPKLRQLEVKVPVIVVGCKLDLRDENQQVSLEQVMSPIMQQFREIETCIECSAYKHIQIPEVFYYAQKAVLHPTGPLFDQETQTLKDQCVQALKRIFILCDHDRDGALSDAELNDFQVKCFNAPLQPSEIVGVKRVVQEKLPEGVNEHGLTLTGFLFLHALFIEKGRLETTWTVLRKFGYNNDIRLADELIPSLPKRSPDQSVELTNEAIEFLKSNFDLFGGDGDGALRPRELGELFSTAPASPYSEFPSKDAAFGGLSLDGFLSQWALMTLLNPASTMENLIYIGYPGEVSSAIRVTRKRRVDRKKQQSERNVFQCFVFGPKKAGKSALLDSFLGRPFSETYNPTTEERYAVNVVDQPGGPKKTLVMREIPEDGVEKFLRNKEALAACDIAVFVHDSSDESSWKRATELLVEVASHGETTGFEVPCLIVAAKDDLDAFPSAIQHSTRVSQDMGTEAPIPISAKLGDFNNVFRKIVTAAEHPHLSIPETEAGRTRKQYHKILNRSLMFISVGAAVAMVGVAAHRVYAARRNASG